MSFNVSPRFSNSKKPSSTPGPGAYSPKTVSTGSSATFSKAERFSEKPNPHPGPGAYSPKTQSNSPAYSFSKASRFSEDRTSKGSPSPTIPGTREERPPIQQIHLPFIDSDDEFGRRSYSMSSSDSSARGDELRDAATAFINRHADSRMAATNTRVSGTMDQGLEQLWQLIDTHNIVVVGEGSHEENATVQVLCHPNNTPQSLIDRGVGTIYVEHLYPSHLEELGRGNQAIGEDHLNTHTFMRFDSSQSPAPQLCTFLRACMQVGIQVVSIESQELYLHYQADRVPNLNSHALDIISAQDHSQPGHKALVYIGAAHTNSHNDPGRLTPGMTETLQPRGATEMLIVAGHPNESPQIHSVGDGQVFGVS